MHEIKSNPNLNPFLWSNCILPIWLSGQATILNLLPPSLTTSFTTNTSFAIILTKSKFQNGNGCPSRHFSNCPTFHLFVNIFISGAKTETNFISIEIRTAWNPLQVRNNWNTAGKTSCNYNSAHRNLYCNRITNRLRSSLSSIFL